MHMKKYFYTLPLLATLSAQATLTPTIERGDKNIYFNSPGGIQEVCVIPKHYPEAKYSKKDLKTEEKLCSLSFYDVSVAEQQEGKSAVAICAKLNSTNPGINIFQATDKLSKQEIEAKDCSEENLAKIDKNIKLDKIGKYKNSTSCSYTPSIIGYYHVSRILGGIGRVPPSVLRSMNIETHKNLARQGTDKTQSGALINQTWSSLKSFLTAGLGSSKKDLLLSDDGKQSYGAITTNPKKEEFYGDFFTKGTDRAVAFRDKNPLFQKLRDQRSISQLVKPEWNQTNVQFFMQLNDMTEFILLDHLLDQQDRFGNIAYQDKYIYLKHDKDDANDIKAEFDGLKLEDYKTDLADGLVVAGFSPLKIRSMIMKDNDCGVSKANVVKQAELLKYIAHMNPKTYHKLLEFQQSIRNNQKFFTSNLMFTAVDFKELVANVDDAVQILKTNCKSGALKLDLNLKKYFTTGKAANGSCELEE